MIDFDRELRATLDEHARLAPPPVDAPRAIRVARRRQLGVVLTALAVVAAVAVASVAGVSALLRASERRVPAEPPPFSPGPLEAAPIGSYTFGGYVFHGLTVASDGAVWWTGPGITRFDPTSGSLRTFTVADDPAFGDISVMAPARDGGVWTLTGGVIRRFDGERFREALPARPVGSPSGVSFIAEGPDGTVWGLGGEGPLRWDGESWASVTSEGFPHNWDAGGNMMGEVTPEGLHFTSDGQAIAVDASGGVWVSGTGVSRFDGATWTTWTMAAITIAPGSIGDVWIGNFNGAARFRNGSWTAYPGVVTGTGIGDDVLSIAPTEEGVFVAGSGGMARFDGTTWSPVTAEDGLEGGGAWVAAGPSGVWAATSAGLFRLEGSRFEPQVATEGPVLTGGPQIAAASSDEVWAEGYRGVWRLEGSTWTEYPGLPGGSVTEIAVAPDGVPWVITEQGLARFDGSAWEQVESGRHDAIAFAPDGTVWTVSGDDRRVRPVGGTALPALADMGSVWSMALAVGLQDDVWVGWEIGNGYAIEGGGLAHFEGGDWQTVALDPSVDRFAVHDLEVTPDGDVWVSGWGSPACEGCDYATVARFRNGGWTAFGEAQGIPEGQLDVTSSGEVLLTTSDGLFVFRDEAWHSLQEGSFDSLSVAPDETVWLAGDGLFRMKNT